MRHENIPRAASDQSKEKNLQRQEIFFKIIFLKRDIGELVSHFFYFRTLLFTLLPPFTPFYIPC